MINSNDWRLDNIPIGIEGITLHHKCYKQPSASWDHEHCVFCWQKIAEPHIPNAIHHGYATVGDREWVCPECFSDFSRYFRWAVIEEYAI